MKRNIILLSALTLGIAGFGYAANAPGTMNGAPAMKNGTAPTTQPAPTMMQDQQPAPSLDRFSSPDDQRLGVEVRGIIVETVGPNESKEVFIFVDKGDVQLTGTAKSEERKKAIIDALRANKGVKSVNNKLTITPAVKK